MKNTFTVARYTKQLPAKTLKKKSTELTVKQAKTLDKVNKVAKTLKNVESTVGKGVVSKSIASGDIDGALVAFQRQAFSRLVELIPLAEAQYRKDPRQSNAYAMNAMVSAAREIAQDLAATNDRAQLAETVLHDLLEPMMKAMVQQYLQKLILLKSFLTDKAPPSSLRSIIAQLDQDAREYVEYMQLAYQTTAEQLQSVIQGQQ